MNQEFVLGKLAELLRWDEETARREFAWLRLMSRMKYDGYQELLAGLRFIESLVNWLQQFKPEERECAYQFIRHNLVFISHAEMRHLVELFFPETVQPRLIQEVAKACGIRKYQVWSNQDASKLFGLLLRKTVFIELSDGAMIDIFRRSNEGIISNEQILTAPRINTNKWDELLSDLRDATGVSDDRFEFVYLVDDFAGSGTTLLRKENDLWKGKLVRFWEDIEPVVDTHFANDWVLCVHHYLCTCQADETVRERDLEIRTEKGDNWFKRVEFSYGTRFPADFPIDLTDHAEFAKLVQTYYDDSIETKHVKVGGADARMGFSACALPLILEHNTPNNSVSLLWAESAGVGGKPAMRPLFRRRQRHI